MARIQVASWAGRTDRRKRLEVSSPGSVASEAWICWTRVAAALPSGAPERMLMTHQPDASSGRFLGAATKPQATAPPSGRYLAIGPLAMGWMLAARAPRPTPSGTGTLVVGV